MHAFVAGLGTEIGCASHQFRSSRSAVLAWCAAKRIYFSQHEVGLTQIPTQTEVFCVIRESPCQRFLHSEALHFIPNTMQLQKPKALPFPGTGSVPGPRPGMPKSVSRPRPHYRLDRFHVRGHPQPSAESADQPGGRFQEGAWNLGFRV